MKQERGMERKRNIEIKKKDKGIQQYRLRVIVGKGKKYRKNKTIR